MTREEIKDFCDMKAQLEPENEDIFKAIVKTLEQETVSKESYDHEYFLRKEFEIKIARLEQQEPILDKIRAEIEKAVWEDVIVSLDGTDEVRIPRLDPDDVFEIINKYKAETENP